MNRRSNAISGWVNFPVDSEDWKNTMEGGMTVKLVVPVPLEDNWSQCCEVFATEPLANVLAASDSILDNTDPDYHYYSGDSPSGMIPCYAIVTIGSTGWSGYNASKGYWKCQLEDLTEDGKHLYHRLHDLYNVKPHILTYLDT